jgi:ketosteroid isomerase-like protein
VAGQNVDVVREFLDAYHAGDDEHWMALLSTDVVLVEAPEFPGAGVREGRDAAVATIGDWSLAWSEMSFEADQFEVAGARVLAIGSMRMRGEGTGMVFENPAAFLFTVEDGSIVRVEVFLDVEEGRRRTRERTADA